MVCPAQCLPMKSDDCRADVNYGCDYMQWPLSLVVTSFAITPIMRWIGCKPNNPQANTVYEVNMSKKRNNKRPSARGHVEDNVIRWRLEQRLVRVRKGNKKLPVNVMDKDWITGNNSDLMAPPIDHSKTPPPDNVTSIAKAREAKASKPEQKSSTKRVQHGWLHDKSVAIDEFKSWSRITNELGRKRCGSELWTKSKRGKLSSPSLEAQRQRSAEGHKALKFKKPPSTTHNPFLKSGEADHGGYAPSAVRETPQSRPLTWYNQRNAKPLNRVLAPSGLPISYFTEGPFKPKENAVVYTTPPPTPTRDWRVAANDANQVSVRRTPDVDSTEYKLTGAVQWYIANVEVQKWPTAMYQFAHWTKDGPVINTGAVNKACADPEQELKVFKLMFAGLERQYRMLDIALEDATQDARLWRMENQANLNEIKLLEFELAHRSGDVASADEIRRELNIGNAKPPENADELLSQFKLYQSFEKFNGPEFAYARAVYGDPSLGQVIRDHADMKAAHRQHLFDERESLRRIAVNVSERVRNSGYKKYPEIYKFRQKAALYRIKSNIKAAEIDDRPYAQWWKAVTENKSSTYYSRLKYRRLSRDVTMLRHWGTRATPFNRKRPVDYQQVINDVVGVRSVEYSSPSLVYHYKELGFKHKKYMNNRMAKFYLSQTWKGSVVKAVNKVVEFFNTEVNPRERKRIHTEAQERSRAKYERKKRKQERAAKEAARRAYRLAH